METIVEQLLNLMSQVMMGKDPTSNPWQKEDTSLLSGIRHYLCISILFFTSKRPSKLNCSYDPASVAADCFLSSSSHRTIYNESFSYSVLPG